MSATPMMLDDDLMTLLRSTNQPVEVAARELIVLGMYARRIISSGKAAELLGMHKLDFIKRASDLGIPYFDMTEEEWRAECEILKGL